MDIQPVQNLDRSFRGVGGNSAWYYLRLDEVIVSCSKVNALNGWLLGSNQMHLERSHVLQIKLVRRAAKESAELGDGMYIRSLSRRRQIAHRHVLDHAATQRAHLSHRGLPFQGWGQAPKPWQTKRP
jgi:hypothetical protein